MRAFVALEISSNSVLDSLMSFQAELQATGADVKLVERENIHFTVKFLGEISEVQAGDASSRLKALSLKGGEVSVKGAGAFPSSSRPSVVWAGVDAADEPMVSSIASPIIEALRGIGEEDSRPFRAHATVARVRNRSPNRALAELLGKSANRPFGSTALTEVKLKSSLLTPSGPVYTDVGAFPLA